MGGSSSGMMVFLPSKGKYNTWLGKPNKRRMVEYLANKIRAGFGANNCYPFTHVELFNVSRIFSSKIGPTLLLVLEVEAVPFLLLIPVKRTASRKRDCFSAFAYVSASAATSLCSSR